jgi:hypothetical protein
LRPPAGSARELVQAKADFKAAWLAFKAKHSPERLVQAFKEMHIRDRDQKPAD